LKVTGFIALFVFLIFIALRSMGLLSSDDIASLIYLIPVLFSV